MSYNGNCNISAGQTWRKRIIAGGILFLLALGSLFGAESLSTRRFGLFIGSNNGGRDRIMLRYAVSDAKSVSRIFGGMGGITTADNILLIEPTTDEINRQLDNLHRLSAQSRRNSQRTELVFYYSGHSDENGILLNRERYGYRELRERINNVQADMRIVILDSCSSGAITRAKGGVKTQPFLFDGSVSAEGYAFLTSSSADETSQESDIIESSYFTHSILAGLRGAADSVGDGRVTLNELYRFAYTETLAKTETSMYGPQHPSYDIQISGSGDVVLTDIKETSASLVIAEDLTGRISIRDSSDFLVAELTKISRKPMVLGLEPGSYRITLQQGNSFYRSEITLPENRQTNLGFSDFAMIAGTPGGTRRGNEPEGTEASSADADSSSGPNLYTFFFNNVSEQFRFPLFGFINIARGNHTAPQFGFVNWNTGNFSSLQLSFINTIGGDLNGLQGGFVNTAAGSVNGVQWGFVNTALGDTQGVQWGFVNTGAGDTQGAKLGFVNTTAGDTNGAQVGFVNVTARKLKGVQFGFINYVDSVESGVPIGFISIVRNGGYRAVEYSFSEFYPFGLGVKLGLEKFYTTISAHYRAIDEIAWEHFALGIGMGSIINIVNGIFINPELNYSVSPGSGINQQLVSFVPSFGIKLGKHFSVSAGPAVTWAHVNDDEKMQKPLFHIYKHDIDDNNSIFVGLRAFVRLLF